MRNPVISIMLVTYNHEKYIAEALDSILMQETEYWTRQPAKEFLSGIFSIDR